MSRIRNALAAKDRALWFMGLANVALALSLMFTVYRLSVMPARMPLHLPPDVSQGATLYPGRLPPATAYTYARYLWQQLNTWHTSGAEEYGAAIEAMTCYLTPAFREHLTQNERDKRRNGELNRTRQVADAHRYEAAYVHKFDETTFGVWLDQRLTETVRGQPVKDVAMRYPLYLVADPRPCNLLHFSLDGFMAEPSRLTGGTP